MNILAGYAVPLQTLSMWDHTYVKCEDNNYVWPCFGRGDGGDKICSGEGRVRVANCLSIPDSTAGISYGITGVCHQAANRILKDAGLLVYKARGYGVSVSTYGTYGTYGTDANDFFSKTVPKCETISSDLSLNFTQKILDLYSKPTKSSKDMMIDSATLLGKEFELFMLFKLRDNLDTNKIRSVLKLQADMLKEKERMEHELDSTDLNIEKYAKEMNDLIKDRLIIYLDILGKHDYQKLFNLSPLEKNFVLIDPKIASQVHSQR